MRFGGARDDGQALVETAIVMPLYVFLILGLLQLGLMHQARLLTKYAAYQAVRAGAMHNADVKEMEKAALGVLLPLASRKSGRNEYIKKIDSGSAYAVKWGEYWLGGAGNFVVPGVMKIAQVTVCGPIRPDFGGKKKGEIDFDDPKYDSGDWKTNQATKLRAQVTFHYRMPIPFANAVIERILWNLKVPYVLHLKKKPLSMPKVGGDFLVYDLLASQGIYVIPIRANYTMRMQSNVYLKNIPQSNKCVVPWSFKK